MKRLPALFLVLAMVAVPSIAQKVTIDYAHDFDFDPVKTFAYIAPTDSGARDQLSDNRLRSAIIKELKEGGLRQVEADADLYVTYHVTTQDNTVFSTTQLRIRWIRWRLGRLRSPWIRRLPWWHWQYEHDRLDLHRRHLDHRCL